MVQYFHKISSCKFPEGGSFWSVRHGNMIFPSVVNIHYISRTPLMSSHIPQFNR